MWEIWTNLLLPKALKSCPKSSKLPNLVTLYESSIYSLASSATQPSLYTYTNSSNLFRIKKDVCQKYRHTTRRDVASFGVLRKNGISLKMLNRDVHCFWFWVVTRHNYGIDHQSPSVDATDWSNSKYILPISDDDRLRRIFYSTTGWHVARAKK